MKRYFKLISIFVGVVLLLARVQDVAAQQATSFEQLQILVENNDAITVTDADGQEAEGRILNLSPSLLELSVNGVSRQFSQIEVREIKRRGGDPIGNGARNGAFVGLRFGGALAVLFCASDLCAYALPSVGFYTALGAGLGAGIDALVQGE